MTTGKKKALVDIWAKQYERSRPLADAEIIDLPTGERWKTDKSGYVHAEIEPGRVLTLAFNKAGFPAIQTASVTVPEEGLTGPEREITLQVPGRPLYKALMLAFGKPKAGRHHMVTTVAGEGRNLHNDLGESGVTVTLRRRDGGVERENAIYLGTFLGKTEWLRPILTERLPFLRRFRNKTTSHDGGAIFKNVPPGDYVVEAHKKDAQGQDILIRSAAVTVYPNSPAVINLSPPQGPKVLGRGLKPA